jgi:hypothetical protein
MESGEIGAECFPLTIACPDLYRISLVFHFSESRFYSRITFSNNIDELNS